MKLPMATGSVGKNQRSCLMQPKIGRIQKRLHIQ
jgi:hypothetical protein